MDKQTLTPPKILRFEDLNIEIFVNSYPVAGILSGTAKHWNFASTNPYFLHTYPSGVMYSFSIHSESDGTNDFGRFHAAMTRKLQELEA
jgi:hypothetical protein